MNINSPFSKLFVVLTAGVLLFAALGTLSFADFGSERQGSSQVPLEDAAIGDSLNTAPTTGTRAGSPRTVLVELFTQWNCGPCASANPAINELSDVYGTDQLVMIAYHMSWPSPNNDPFYNYNTIENDLRKNYYGVSSVPDTFFDGTIHETGGTGGTTGRYTTYKSHIESRLPVSSPLTITLEGYLDMNIMTGYVNVSIEATDTLPAGTLNVRTAVTEDNRYGQGNNLEVRHRNVFRDLLADEPLPPLILGGYHNFTRSFAIDVIYSLDNLGIVAFVQNDPYPSNGEVLQAAYYDYIPQKILVVDDDQSTNPDGYEDDIQEVLSFADFAFDSYVLNEVGSPSSGVLANYDVVLWTTAATSSNTLTAADQTAISSYLDGGFGSLFMSGQNIGSDIGGTAFYQNYLHATFVTDDNDEMEMEGIPGDPISDPFFGGSLPISADSPSEIAPVAPAITTFVYLPSGNPAAVRATHDINSRVVYLACMYFESSDILDTKALVMNQILSWLTDTQNLIVLSPGMNLISIPAEQLDPSIDTVLNSISGQYDAVQWFDASEDNWKHFHDSKPVSMNDLNEIHHFIGFWIHVTTPDDTAFSYSGVDFMDKQILHLYLGWNLVGYPSRTEYDVTTGLDKLTYGGDVECIQTYDAATQQWVELGPSDNFELGKGYWIYSNAEQDWEVPL